MLKALGPSCILSVIWTLWYSIVVFGSYDILAKITYKYAFHSLGTESGPHPSCNQGAECTSSGTCGFSKKNGRNKRYTVYTPPCKFHLNYEIVGMSEWHGVTIFHLLRRRPNSPSQLSDGMFTRVPCQLSLHTSGPSHSCEKVVKKWWKSWEEIDLLSYPISQAPK